MKKKLALILIFIVNLFILSNFKVANAFINDNEGSDGHVLASQSLDLKLLSDDQSFSKKKVLPGEKTERTFFVLNVGDLDFNYSLEVKNLGEDEEFCEALKLKVAFESEDGEEKYDGLLKDFKLNIPENDPDLFLVQDEDHKFFFTISLPDTADKNLSKKKCKFDLVSKAWMEGFEYGKGYYDLETFSSEISCGEFKCKDGPIWATAVKKFKQGKLAYGGNITDPERTDPSKVLGAPDNKFVSLGKGGRLTLVFGNPVLDEPGADLTFYEVTNNRLVYPLEKAKVYVSQSGKPGSWEKIGVVDSQTNGTGVTSLDVSSSGFSWIKYLKLVDSTDFGLHDGSADGYDLDAVYAHASACKDYKYDKDHKHRHDDDEDKEDDYEDKEDKDKFKDKDWHKHDEDDEDEESEKRKQRGSVLSAQSEDSESDEFEEFSGFEEDTLSPESIPSIDSTTDPVTEPSTDEVVVDETPKTESKESSPSSSESGT